jgi:glutathione synthase/RimK-type ligase-like ATP-grasp enzyme
MSDIVLATGRDLQVTEEETPLLVAALRERGVNASIEPWGSVESMHAPLVVIRTTWDYTAHCDAFLDWAREVSRVTTLLNPLDVVVWNSHKGYLLELADAAVPVVETSLVGKDATPEVRRATLRRHDGEVVVKPAVSAGAIGVLRCDAASEVAAAHLANVVARGDALVQPFEPGVLGGEVALVYLGGQLSHAVRKRPAADDYRVQVMHGGTVEPHDPSRAQLELGAAALAAVDAELAFARIDVVDTATGPRLMELELIEPQLFLDMDPRAPGRLAEHLVGVLASTESGVGRAPIDR